MEISTQDNLGYLNSAHIDQREVPYMIEIIDFIRSLKLSHLSKVAIIGPGRPNSFLWGGQPSSISPISNEIWEKAVFDTGATLYLYEPNIKYSTQWSEIAFDYRLLGEDRIKVHYFDNAYFQNTALADKSVDLIILMNLFGTHMLADEDESFKIVQTIARVLKRRGILVTGDRLIKDQKITLETLELFLKTDPIRIEYAVKKSSEQTDTPWVAYEVY